MILVAMPKTATASQILSEIPTTDSVPSLINILFLNSFLHTIQGMLYYPCLMNIYLSFHIEQTKFLLIIISLSGKLGLSRLN